MKESAGAIVWRGMNGIAPNMLQRLMGRQPDAMGHEKVDESVPISKMGWWSERQSLAIIYATTDPVSGRKSGYDVLLRGEVRAAPGVSAHDLRKDPKTIVRVTDVYYSLPVGDRRSNIESLL